MGVVFACRSVLSSFSRDSRSIALLNTTTFAGIDQTLLQALILPIFVLPTLLPTPLLEPRYFLIPYVLLRAQIVDVPHWGLAVEFIWYAAINAVTMGVFLYGEREGVGRFMW